MYLGKALKLSLNVKIFASIISEEKITPEIIDALCVVDPEFKRNIDAIRKVLVVKENEDVSAQELNAETVPDSMTEDELKEVAEEIAIGGWGKPVECKPDIPIAEVTVETPEEIVNVDEIINILPDCNISEDEIEKPTTDDFITESETTQRSGKGGLYSRKTIEELINLYPATYSWFKVYDGIDKLMKKTNSEIREEYNSTAKFKDKIGKNNFYRLCNHIRENGLDYKANEIVSKKRSYKRWDFKYIPDDPTKENWKAYPGDPRIMLSENGFVKFNGEYRKPIVSNGAMTVVTENNRKRSIGKMMLETFKPISNKKIIRLQICGQ